MLYLTIDQFLSDTTKEERTGLTQLNLIAGEDIFRFENFSLITLFLNESSSVAFCNALSECISLHHLSLGKHGLYHFGIQDFNLFMKAIKDLPKLTRLTLDDNFSVLFNTVQPRKDGTPIINFANFLRSCPKLQEIELSMDYPRNVPNESREQFIDNLLANPSLHSIKIFNEENEIFELTSSQQKILENRKRSFISRESLKEILFPELIKIILSYMEEDEIADKQTRLLDSIEIIPSTSSDSSTSSSLVPYTDLRILTQIDQTTTENSELSGEEHDDNKIRVRIS